MRKKEKDNKQQENSRSSFLPLYSTSDLAIKNSYPKHAICTTSLWLRMNQENAGEGGGGKSQLVLLTVHLVWNRYLSSITLHLRKTQGQLFKNGERWKAMNEGIKGLDFLNPWPRRPPAFLTWHSSSSSSFASSSWLAMASAMMSPSSAVMLSASRSAIVSSSCQREEKGGLELSTPIHFNNSIRSQARGAIWSCFEKKTAPKIRPLEGWPWL